MTSEFQVLYGDREHVQKVLNQWRHQYILHIHQMSVTNGLDGKWKYHILLQREEQYDGEPDGL